MSFGIPFIPTPPTRPATFDEGVQAGETGTPLDPTPPVAPPPPNIDMGEATVTTAPPDPWNAPRASVANKSASEHSGMTDAGVARSGALFHGASAQADKNLAPFQADEKTALANTEKHYGDEAAAVQAQADVTGQFHREEMDLHHRTMDFYQHAADTEAAMAAQGKAERERYLTGYREQLAAVKQLTQVNGNPLAQLSMGEAIGLAGAQFAQGFLAARGINIDVSGQIDRWVERGIREHQEQIANARQGAQDQLHLYDLARQSSQDDFEARQRYRGFVIEGLKTSILANAAKFNSDIAMARAKEQVAKLDVEKDTTERAIGDSFFNKWHQTKMLELDQAFKMGTLAIERDKNALEERKYKAEIQAREDLKKQGQEFVDIPDVETQVVKGPDGKDMVVPKNNWRIPASDKAGVAMGREARNNWANYNDQWQKTMKLRDEAYAELDSKGLTGFVGKGWLGAGIRESAKFQQYQAAKNQLMAAQLLAETGKVANESEIKRMEERFPDEKIFGQNGAEVFMNGRDTARKQFERKMESASGKVGITASPGAAADERNFQNGGAPLTGVVNKEAAIASRAYGEYDGASAPYSQYEAERRGGSVAPESVGKERAFAEHLDVIAKAALVPDQVISQLKSDESPEKVKKDAIETLNNWATDNNKPEEQRHYAAYLLQRVTHDPQGLLKSFAGE